MTNVKPLLTAVWNTEVKECCTDGKYSVRCNPQLGKSRRSGCEWVPAFDSAMIKVSHMKMLAGMPLKQAEALFKA